MFDNWKVGGDFIAVSGQYLRGDENNLNPMLPGYWVLNLNTTYQVSKHVEVFGLVQNVINNRYYTFGTFFETSEIPFLGSDRSAHGQPRRAARRLCRRAREVLMQRMSGALEGRLRVRAREAGKSSRAQPRAHATGSLHRQRAPVTARRRIGPQRLELIGLKKSPQGGIWSLPPVTEVTKRSRWSGGNFRRLNALPASCMRAPWQGEQFTE